jgi:hypothetical protein
MKAIKVKAHWFVLLPNNQYTKDESLSKAIVKACVKMGVSK